MAWYRCGDDSWWSAGARVFLWLLAYLGCPWRRAPQRAIRVSGKFANGAAYAAFSYAVASLSAGSKVEMDQASASGDNGGSTSFEEAKATLRENGLVPDKVLSDPNVLRDRTNEYGLIKDNEVRAVLSMDEVAKYEKAGWSQIEGYASRSEMNIFRQATEPAFEAHVGLRGRYLTGQQNLVQTIYHEYKHFIGTLTHGPSPGTFEWMRWGRMEGADLNPVFDR